MGETREMNVVVVGLGGIGSALAPKLVQFCQHLADCKVNFTLVDGDKYEPKNGERQQFSRLGNKAEVTVADLSKRFDGVGFTAEAEYLTEENLDFIIDTGYIVFLCVDNHKTRKLVDDYCATLDDIVLINGGNDLLDGNVQVVVRRDGKQLTQTISEVHDETANPEDKSPDEMGCEELAESEPQLFFVNDSIACVMCWPFYWLATDLERFYSEPGFGGEIYFDLQLGQANACDRTVTVAQPNTEGGA